MRAEPKTIILNGRRWQIGLFNPMTGNFIALKILGKVGAVAAAVAAGAVVDKSVLFIQISQELSNFSSSEFYEIQSEALRVCNDIGSATGDEIPPTQALLADGRWGVKELEQDPITVMALTCHALTVNMLPFFEGSRLKEVFETFKGYKLPSFDVQT